MKILPIALLLVVFPATASAQPGIPPVNKSCPSSHPIKGNFTTYDGSRCIAHIPGTRWYAATVPERCYATMADAVADGCRPARQ